MIYRFARGSDGQIHAQGQVACNASGGPIVLEPGNRIRFAAGHTLLDCGGEAAARALEALNQATHWRRDGDDLILQSEILVMRFEWCPECDVNEALRRFDKAYDAGNLSMALSEAEGLDLLAARTGKADDRALALEILMKVRRKQNDGGALTALCGRVRSMRDALAGTPEVELTSRLRRLLGKDCEDPNAGVESRK